MILPGKLDQLKIGTISDNYFFHTFNVVAMYIPISSFAPCLTTSPDDIFLVERGTLQVRCKVPLFS